jgi:Tol biopolymer transport system component
VHPAWSPDGQFIAYHEMDGGGIWIVPARGGVARRVSDFGSRPAWSPDGAALAFQSMPVTDMGRPRAPGLLSTIWLVDVAGGPPRALAAGRTSGGPQLSPAWTSDGMVLFAESAGDGRTSIWRVGANGTGLQRVATHPRLSPEFAVDPRGRGFYFVALPINAIWWQALGPDGTAAGDPVATGLATSGQLTSKLALAPDGRGLAWTSLEASGHVWSRTLAGNGPAAATALTQGLRVRYSVPAAARDGRIALTGSRTGAASILYVLDPGRGLRPVTVDDHPHANPQWLPDEREVAFLTDAPAAAFGAVDVETGRERVLFPLSALPLPTGLELFNASLPNNVVAAPDFSRLAMTLLKGGVPNVWVAEIRDGAPRGPMVQRTFETEGGSYPAWSPDGRWIAYQCLAEGMITHVCVADAETGARRQLTAEPGQSWIGGWVDDDGILFAAQRHGVWNVMQVSRTTGQVHAVTADAVPRTYVRYPRWDAVGRRVIFERGEYTARVFRVTLSE